MNQNQNLLHPKVSRRTAVQAGAIGLLGLGSNHLRALQAADSAAPTAAKCCIYIFLSGGLSQHESLDPEPQAPRGIRSEFGRTPKLSTLTEPFPDAGRDHWGAVQSVFFAGGGVKGGTVIGSSDELGAYPASNPQKPENMAATMYSALGIPATAVWHDEFQRPHQIYHGEPIAGLI